MDEDGIERLITRVSMGDRQAFSKLYTHTSPKLFAVALRVLKTDARAEDVLQEVFVRVWQQAGQYRADGLAPSTWLTSLTRDAAVERLRRDAPAGSQGRFDLEEGRAEETEAQEALSEEGRALRHCLRALPAAHEAMLRSAYLNGASYQTFAQATGTGVEAVRGGLQRSLTQLKTCLGG